MAELGIPPIHCRFQFTLRNTFHLPGCERFIEEKMNLKYILKLSGVSFFVGAGIYCWNFFSLTFSNPHIWFILPYFVLFTMINHYWLTNKDDAKQFTVRFMGSTGIKLFVNLIIILIYGLNNKRGAIPFALAFLIIYFLFTFFEISQLLKHFKTKVNTPVK